MAVTAIINGFTTAFAVLHLVILASWRPPWRQPLVHRESRATDSHVRNKGSWAFAVNCSGIKALKKTFACMHICMSLCTAHSDKLAKWQETEKQAANCFSITTRLIHCRRIGRRIFFKTPRYITAFSPWPQNKSGYNAHYSFLTNIHLCHEILNIQTSTRFCHTGCLS